MDKPSDPSTAARLRLCHKQITQLWVERVRSEVGQARQVGGPIIINTLPNFIDHIVMALSPEQPETYASEHSSVALEHGRERARLTDFSLSQVMREYQLLRDTILEVLGGTGEIPKEHEQIIRNSFDHAMTEAVTGYVSVQNEIRQEFIMLLSHDLRGPLTAARACAQMILRYPDQLEKHPIFAAKAIDNLGRADQMIQDLLDASKVRAGQPLVLQLEELDLHELAQGVLHDLATVEGDRFVLDSPGTLRGRWSREGLRRALYNLLTNALKYGDRAHPIRLILGQRKESDHVNIVVHNLGNPISPEDQQTLFAPFRQAQTARASTQKGWGLGLALVRGVVEAHGGAILVDSSEEKGTTFTLDLPRDAAQAQSQRTQE